MVVQLCRRYLKRWFFLPLLMDDCKHDLEIGHVYGFRTGETIEYMDVQCKKCASWFEIVGAVIREHNPSWNEEEE